MLWAQAQAEKTGPATSCTAASGPASRLGGRFGELSSRCSPPGGGAYPCCGRCPSK
jgi:hypothetical protein